MITESDIKAEYVTVNEVAEILGMYKSNVLRALNNKKFEGAFKLSDIWLIPRESVLNYTRRKPGPKKRDRISNREILENALKEMNKGR